MPATSGHGGGLRFDIDGESFNPIILFWLPKDQSQSQVDIQIQAVDFQRVDSSIYTVTQGNNGPGKPNLVSGPDLKAVSEEATIVDPSNKRSLIGLPLSSVQETHGKCTISMSQNSSDIIDFAVFPTTGDAQKLELRNIDWNPPGKAAVTLETDGLEPGLVAIALYNMPQGENGESPEEKVFGAGNGKFMKPVRRCYVYIAYARKENGKNNPNLAPTAVGVAQDLSWSSQLRNMKIDFKRVLQVMTGVENRPLQPGEDSLYRMSIRHKSATREFMDLDDFDFVGISTQNSEATFDLGPLDAPESNDYPSGMYILGKPTEPVLAAEAIPQGSIDINNAAADELMRLSGIGKVCANSIVEHRPYSTAEELKKVPGIGPKRYEEMVDFISV